MSFFDYPRSYFPRERDEQGNAVAAGLAIPSYNRMGSDDSLMVQQAKQQAQNRQYQNLQRGGSDAFGQDRAKYAMLNWQAQQNPQDGWGALAQVLNTYTQNALHKKLAAPVGNDAQAVAAGIAGSGGSGLANLLGSSGQGLEGLGKIAPYFAQYLGIHGF